MKNIRIIPRLDIKGPNLVKGIHLEGLRTLGKPHRFARHYYEQGADELLYMDVVASLYGRNSLEDIIKITSQEIFIPLTVGGGLRTLDDIRRVLRAGADKVSINTAAIGNPSFIKEASREFGSSTIVISIEAIQMPDGTYEAYTDNGREQTGVNALEWARTVEDLGAGEILVTSIDREGTGMGYEISLTRQIADAVSIPVIACGGAGQLKDVSDVIRGARIDAVSMASVLHYHVIKHHEFDDDFSSEGNTEFLKSGQTFRKIQDTTLPEMKNYLRNQFIDATQDVLIR